MARRGLLLLVLLVAVALVIQVVPYGHRHTNPPSRIEPRWDSPSTRALAARACFNCHSNETRWPWYSNVAPVSWLLEHDVDEGRSDMNFSEWDRRQKEATKSAKEVRSHDMPPWYYIPLHRNARLSDSEREALARGLAATVGTTQ